jgi:ATP-dependent RNA helicase DeaD
VRAQGPATSGSAESFEDLEVLPELVEALSAEGIERPTPLQEAAIPILRKGNNLVLVAGPGSGLLVTWLVPLLERIEPDGGPASILALTATRDAAGRLAESAARLAAVTGHAVAALGSPWALPQRAQVMFGTPTDVLARVAMGDLALDAVQVVVLDQANQVERLDGLDEVERVLAYVPPTTQRVLTSLPVSATISDLAERHFRRALTLPAPEDGEVPDRGRVRFRITPEPRDGAALALAQELLAGGVRHLLFFCRSEDRAADLGDYLTLHGFVAGAPGDETVPVWLGVDALAARAAVAGSEGVNVVSYDVPTDPDSLDRRHGMRKDGVVLVLARELPHLKSLGRLTGYDTVPYPPPGDRTPSSIEQLRATLERAIAEEDTAPYLSALEPLFERFDPAEVAAAAVALLRGRGAAESTRAPTPSAAEPPSAPAWAKLFIGVGERDGLRPADLVGAITGEAGVDGRAIGKVEIRESHSLVEVHDAVARAVIKALNGTTIKGRAVRADFDRPRRSPPRAPRTPRAR